MSTYKKDLGRWGERTAERYLRQRGYDIVTRHWQRREGEIDIVAFDRAAACLVFVEVKTRTSEAFGRPDESLDRRKQLHLEQAITCYVEEESYRGQYRCDVCFVQRVGQRTVLKHLQNVALS